MESIPGVAVLNRHRHRIHTLNRMTSTSRPTHPRFFEQAPETMPAFSSSIGILIKLAIPPDQTSSKRPLPILGFHPTAPILDSAFSDTEILGWASLPWPSRRLISYHLAQLSASSTM